MGLRWITQRRCIPDLALSISASIFDFIVILAVVALIDYNFLR